MAARFQIGSDNYKYIYSDANMEVNAKPVYRCSRGVEKSPDGYVLWLNRTSQGQWIAREAKRDSTQPVQEGRKVFRTQKADIDDIGVPGPVAWQWWDTDNDSWVNFDFVFHTKRV